MLTLLPEHPDIYSWAISKSIFSLPQDRNHKVLKIPKHLHRYTVSGLQSPVSVTTVM